MTIETPLIRAGEEFRSRVRFTREQITQFARLTGDANPLHHDRQAAERASFGEIVASGQQTSAQMIGMVATHLARSDEDEPRDVIGLNYEFTFRHPVFPDQEVQFQWRVAEVERSTRRGGVIAHLDGTACVGGRPCIVARGTVLVRRASARP